MEKANLGLNQLSGIDAELKRKAEKKNRSLENLTQHGNGSESTLKVKRKKLKKQKKSLMSMVEQHDGQVVPASTPGSEPLSERSKKKKKRKGAKGSEKNPMTAANRDAYMAPPSSTPLPLWPFQPHPADHCETPLVAYQDLAPTLQALASKLYGPITTRPAVTSEVIASSRLRIYDPYFCTGRVKENLRSLGFTEVRNVCEDFYAAADQGTIPEFDVLVTNPPVSS